MAMPTSARRVCAAPKLRRRFGSRRRTARTHNAAVECGDAGEANAYRAKPELWIVRIGDVAVMMAVENDAHTQAARQIVDERKTVRMAARRLVGDEHIGAQVRERRDVIREDRGPVLAG